MPKRGSTQPWKVTFTYPNGVGGTRAYEDEWTAQRRADEITARGGTATVTYKPKRVIPSADRIEVTG